VQPFGGTLEQARAFAPDGSQIPLSVRGGRLTPLTLLTPGERVSVDVVIRRPGWLAWALGRERRERLSLRAPAAHVTERWLKVGAGSSLRLTFDRPVSAVAYGPPSHLVRHDLAPPSRSIVLGQLGASGSVEIAAAARAWERLGAPALVTWFPRAGSPVVVSDPAPGASIAPVSPLRLTFSDPVADVLGSARPRLSPSMPGRWLEPDSHTLVFEPSGLGAGLATDVRAVFPRPISVGGAPGQGVHETRSISWTVPAGSTLRLQQLLAQAGYLPVDWKAAGPAVARTPTAEVEAAVAPPAGRFVWRYPNTPNSLRSLWSAGQPNAITRGAVMMFEDTHALAVDGVAGREVWRALLADALAGKRRHSGYSYVFVHRNLPQSLNLWHDGSVIVTSPGNTGVPAAPTVLGTFPVFEHIPVGTMSGTNPDGTHYHDPGIRYISYFNGGDAIHAFNRASYGTPQSLGCVELPLAAAGQVWPYTPIGTLVTVEN